MPADGNKQRPQEIAIVSSIPKERKFRVDIANEDTVGNMADRIHEAVPSLDVLINAAGIGILDPLESLRAGEMMNSLQTNLLGSFHLMKAYLQLLSGVMRQGEQLENQHCCMTE